MSQSGWHRKTCLRDGAQILCYYWHSQTHKTSVILRNSESLSFLSLLCSLLLSLLLLGIGGEELFVLLKVLTSGLVTTNDLSLVLVLSAETGLGDETLDLGGLIESLVLALDLTGNNVLANIVLLLVEREGLDDVVSSLGTEAVGTLNIGNTSDLLLTLLNNTEEDGSEVSTDNAATDWLSLALTSAGRSVTLLA